VNVSVLQEQKLAGKMLQEPPNPPLVWKDSSLHGVDHLPSGTKNATMSI
jgi:hypothetical protein